MKLNKKAKNPNNNNITLSDYHSVENGDDENDDSDDNDN